jgi:hypothetical protein
MIQWAVVSTNVHKTSGQVTVGLTRTGTATLPVKVSYTTYAISAGSSNYTTTAGIVTFAAGITSSNITVPILNDHVVEPTRQFSLELISASGGAWLGNQLSSVVSILDTNTPPKFTGKAAFLANGGFQFQFSSSTGLVLTVQSSTDLSSWKSLQTFTNTTTLTTFTDTAPGPLKTFYRVASP